MARSKKVFQPAKTKTCNGKNCYSSQKEAEQVAQEQELRDVRQELKIGVYRCVYCGKWHLTSKK
ncbi:hypothetical protein FWF93_01295 [Candidatus Saccharibacteria bacterium]|jgi:aspartate carbamoyltransferase regulatory subunit|nr:hypothetical protein [Candidatus Saccharibacteria bacterium]